MPHDVYYDFTQRPEQMRRIGARGGRTTARNRRERLSTAGLPTPPAEIESRPEYRQETVAAAIAILDAQFPWLRGAEKRHAEWSAATATQTSSANLGGILD